MKAKGEIVLSSAHQVELARGIATRAHEGQYDKVGAAYIEHPAAVAALVQQLAEFADLDEQTRCDVVAAAWLHDTIEDTDETADSLAAAGISPRAVAAVVALTRTAKVKPDDYYAGVKAQRVARLVKTADVAHNLSPERVAQLDEKARVRLAAKYAHALEKLGVDRSVITALHAGRAAP